MFSTSVFTTILNADATLMALATGGVYDTGTAGDLGINRTTTPDAFDANKRILPCIFIRGIGPSADGGIVDKDEGVRSYKMQVDIYFYQASGYNTTATMRDRVSELLDNYTTTGVFTVDWLGDVTDQRDYDLKASLERSSYEVTGIKV